MVVSLLALTLLLPVPSAARAGSTVEVRYLAAGSIYETPMYIIRGLAPGPVFLITGGVHGSELAGWMAAGRFADREIQAGTFIVIPEANRPAVGARTRLCPDGRFDLNRAFPTRPNASPTRLIAREIWSVFTDYRVEWFVDLHEAVYFYNDPKRDSIGQTLIHYPGPTATRMGNLAVQELNQGISRRLHKFTLLNYPVPGSIARAAGDYLGVNSYIMETSRELPLATRINYQVQVVEIFLRELGMSGR